MDVLKRAFESGELKNAIGYPLGAVVIECWQTKFSSTPSDVVVIETGINIVKVTDI